MNPTPASLSILTPAQVRYAKALALSVAKRTAEEIAGQEIDLNRLGALAEIRVYAVVQCGKYHGKPEPVREALYDQALARVAELTGYTEPWPPFKEPA